MNLALRWSGALAAVAVLLTSAASEAVAGPRVDIVFGPGAPELERFAASELAGQFKRLFDADVHMGDVRRAETDHLILLGSPRTNPSIEVQKLAWPKLSDQGHLLRSTRAGSRPALIVGGGSPVATLWAAYELGQRFGIRYMLFGDLDPIEPPALKLDGFDVVLEPVLRTRTWRTINDFAIGPESWGLAEQERVLKQLAKLKFNRVMLSLYPWQPFVDFEYGGVKKETGVLWYGYRYPVEGDTAARGVFRGAKLFENPDFAGKSTYAERVAAGTGLARGIVAGARKLGMETAIAISPLEFPKEFAGALKGARSLTGLENLTIGPGAAHRLDDTALTGLVKAQIRAYLKTYPEIDYLYLSLPEFPEWGDHAEEAWKQLDARSGVSQVASLEQLTAVARQRKLIASGDRGAQALRGNVATLEFFNRLLADRDLWRVPGGRTVKSVVVDVDSALYPVLDKVLPVGTECLHFVDYTARRVAVNRELLKTVPARKAPSSLILTLADDNVGVLPQMTYTALGTLVDELKSGGWAGFSTRYWVIGDLDLPTYYLSRASFVDGLTPQQAFADLLTPTMGEAVVGRTLKALELAQEATNLIDDNDIGFSFPVPNVVMKHYAGTEAPPAWWGEVKQRYLAAMDEMYRVNSRAREGGREFSLYLARRFEFGAEYMSCIESVRRA
ncbi:MAG: hypothetical protein HY290_32145, partial [Planctomycetia bacterium]|nr:hypothetical protein [Planctomycetia bacterium]